MYAMYATAYPQYAVLDAVYTCIKVCMHVWTLKSNNLWSRCHCCRRPWGVFCLSFFFFFPSHYFPTITAWPGWLVNSSASVTSIVHCIFNVSCPIHPLLHANLNIWLDILTCSTEWAPPVAVDPLLLLLLSALYRVLASVAVSFHFVLASRTEWCICGVRWD